MSEKHNSSQSNKHRNRSWFFTIAAIFIVMIFFAAVKYWSRQEVIKPVSVEFQTMGTLARVTVFADEDTLTRACELCQNEFAKVVQICSLYDPQSELSRLNAAAFDAPFVCSPEMWQLIMRAKQAWEESGGNFDITVKPLMDIWGFYRKRNAVPAGEEIRETLKAVGFDKLELDEKNRSVRFKVPGMALDMGGIAKGYAADMAAKALAAAGINAGVIDLGGNLRMLDEAPPGKKAYRVAVRDPRQRGKVLPELLTIAPGMAVATSGDYERFIIFEGKKYGHLLSPRTGLPTIVSAVTAVAPSALDADVYSTSCAVGGEEVAKKIESKDPRIKIHFTR